MTAVPAQLRSSLVAPATVFGCAAGGLVAGAATSWLQGELPGTWNTLADSGAVWTLVAALLAWAAARTRGVAFAAGLVALVGEVAGYYLAAAARDIPTTNPERLLWTVAALWVGPLAGLAGFCVRRSPATYRVVAGLGLCGVLAGEGLHLAIRLHYTAAGAGELGVALGAAVAVLVCIPADLRARAAGLAAGTFVAIFVAIMYAALSV